MVRKSVGGSQRQRQSPILVFSQAMQKASNIHSFYSLLITIPTHPIPFSLFLFQMEINPSILKIYNIELIINILMSFLSKLINKVQQVVDDDFISKIQCHQVIAIINRQRQNQSYLPSSFRRPSSLSSSQLLSTLSSLNSYTPEVQFRLLGYEPNIQTISARLKQLKSKLQIVDNYLLQNSQQYITKINLSLLQLQDLREFYSGRKKGQELRNIISRLTQVMQCSRKISKLNIKLKNIKTTTKILKQIPNIKKMNLIQIKTINWQRLNNFGQQLQKNSPSKQSLKCLQHLYTYTKKVNNQEFIYIIDKIKLNLDEFDSQGYEEIIRNYIVIAPTTTLQKLLISLLEEKIRIFYDCNIERLEELTKIGNRVVSIMTNLHKIIKWHRINRALIHKNPQQDTRKHRLSMDSAFSALSQEEIRNRCLSIDSVVSEQGRVSIEINQSVMIDQQNLKSTFSRTLDSCLSELISDHILVQQTSSNRFYEYIHILSKISQVSYNFSGFLFQKLRKVISDHLNRRQFQLYIKNAKELHSSLQIQRNEWNRLPFNNNYRNKALDKYMFRWEQLNSMEDMKKIRKCIGQLFQPKERDINEIKQILDEEEDEEVELEFGPAKMPQFDRIDRAGQEWNPGPQYLGFNEGDSILCQSSFKFLNVLERYFQFLIYVPRLQHHTNYFDHILTLIQYYMYYLFTTFLTPTYKNLFFQPYNPASSIERRYTKKRLTFLYSHLSNFVIDFKSSVDANKADASQHKFHSQFKKDIKEIQADNTQVLRAKVVATQSCRFIIAYLQEMFKRLIPISQDQSNKNIWDRLNNNKATLNELSTILLTESSQKMVGLQLQTMRSLFQTIRWKQPFYQLKQYIAKLSGLIRQSYERLKSSNRGQIPMNIVYRIFVLVWRTLITYAIKLFLQTKNLGEAKKNFQQCLQQLYLQFYNKQHKQLQQLQVAHNIFSTIFKVLNCNDWQDCKELLLTTVNNYDYIFQILMALLQNSEYMQSSSEKEREQCREELRGQINTVLNQS